MKLRVDTGKSCHRKAAILSMFSASDGMHDERHSVCGLGVFRWSGWQPYIVIRRVTKSFQSIKESTPIIAKAVTPLLKEKGRIVRRKVEEDRAHRHELQEGKPWSGANPVVSTHEHNSIRLVQCGKLVGWQGRKRSSNAEKTIFRMSKVRAKSCSTMEKFCRSWNTCHRAHSA